MDFETARLQVCKNLIKDAHGAYVLGPPKTRASRRTVSLAPDTVEVLRAHWQSEHRGKRAPKSGDLLFSEADGGRLDPHNLRRVFIALIKAANVPRIRFHDLRHTAASLLVRHGVPPKLVSDRLGHTDVAFTLKVYTRLYDEQRESAAVPLGELLSAPTKTAALLMEIPAHERTVGVAALVRLHRALDKFLRDASGWAKELALSA